MDFNKTIRLMFWALCATILGFFCKYLFFKGKVEDTEKKERLRLNVSNEILSSEESYVNSLNILNTLFIEPLQQAANQENENQQILSKTEISTLFGNIQTILDLNLNFLEDLKKRIQGTKNKNEEKHIEKTFDNLSGSTRNMKLRTMEYTLFGSSKKLLSDVEEYDIVGYCNVLEKENRNDDFFNKESVQNFIKEHRALAEEEGIKHSCVGDLFYNFAPYFKLYSAYALKHEDGLSFLNQCLKGKHYEKFKDFLIQKENSIECKNQTLQSFLILPIQRVPRYRLLLEQLLKYTDKKKYPYEYHYLRRSLESIKNVATHINDMIKKRQTNEALIKLQDEFVGDIELVYPGRYLIKQGQLMKIGRRRNTKYHFFLFNNLLIYGTKSLRGYQAHQQIKIDGSFSVKEIVSDENEECFGFEISSFVKTFVVNCESKEEKNEWMDAFNSCVGKITRILPSNLNEEKIKAPLLQPFTGGSRCSICSDKLSWISFKNCKRCGKLVDDKCSKIKMILPGTHEKKEKRICDKCYTILKQIKEEEILQKGKLLQNDKYSVSPKEKHQRTRSRPLPQLPKGGEKELRLRTKSRPLPPLPSLS